MTFYISHKRKIRLPKTSNPNNDLKLEINQLKLALTEATELIQDLELNPVMPPTENSIDFNLNADNRLEYLDNNEQTKVLATLEDLEALEIPDNNNSPNLDGLLLKSILQVEKTYYVRTSDILGNNGETAETAFASIEEALLTLSNKYEITGHLILDLEGEFNLNCWYLPQFSGNGQITFRGNDCQIRFIKYNDSTEAYFSNWSGLTINLEDINFVKGESTKVLFEGGKLNFTQVNFGRCNIEFDNCRSTYLTFCEGDVNNSKFNAVRSTLNLTNCTLIAEFKYCQLELINCSFQRILIIEASNLILRNPRVNFRWFTVTATVVNSTVEFKSSWLTFENPGSDPQRQPFILFQNCNIKDFPSNIVVTRNSKFKDVGIIKFVNSFTPEQFNNVHYDFSAHTFISNGCGIDLVNTAILKDLEIEGADIRKDAFSILGGKNYSHPNIPANTLGEAIDHLYQLIKNKK